MSQAQPPQQLIRRDGRSASERSPFRIPVHVGDAEDVVLMLPGFLGFSSIGRFVYFHERVTFALRGAVEARLGRPCLVLTAGTSPAGSLEDRQAVLLDCLHRLVSRHPQLSRIHLVGHSTGGLDAELLHRARRLDGERWSEADEAVLARVVSHTAIATPFAGTCLAESRLGRFVATLSPRYYDAAWRLVVNAGFSVLEDASVQELLKAAVENRSQSAAFVFDLLRSRALIDDLRPARTAELRTRSAVVREVPRLIVPTVAPPEGHAGRRPEDLFAYLYASTQACADAPEESDEVAADWSRVLVSPSWIAAPPFADGLAVDELACDGVVNTRRQLPEPFGELDEVAALVVADHADVMGHYGYRGLRDPGAAKGEPVEEDRGFIRSGAGFADDQLFELYGMVADFIAECDG